MPSEVPYDRVRVSKMIANAKPVSDGLLTTLTNESLFTLLSREKS
jgi:hypothetical protein